MSLLKRNMAANFAGSLWGSIMGLIFIPLYIKFLGIESWGLIGIFTTLQGMFGLLDMGLSSTLNREMARLSALPDKEQEMRDLVCTLEVIYWALAVFVGVTAISLSPFISHQWVKAEGISTETIEQALLLMGFVMALQMPVGFYTGGLMGLQQQVLLNAISVSVSTLRGAATVLILWLISPTIQAYFTWQIVICIINISLLKYFLWRSLPSSDKKAIFKKQLLKGIWRFAAGMSGISIAVVILTQLDKVMLSKLLSLEMFGYYMLASIISMGLGRVYSPVIFSIYPRLTQLVSINDQNELIQLYHKSCQFIAVLILPAAVVLAFFSYEVILLWTQNTLTAGKIYVLVSILTCGTAINVLMGMPYILQLSFGWTRLSFFKTLIAVVLLVPLIIYMTKHYGANGAAIAWLVLNLSIFFLEVPIMHRRILCNEMWQWYWQDVAVPFLTVFIVAGLGRLFFTGATSHFMILINLVVISVLTLGISVITTRVTREWLSAKYLKVNKQLKIE